MADTVYDVPGATVQEVVTNALNKNISFNGQERVVIVDGLSKEVKVINGTLTGLTKKRDE